MILCVWAAFSWSIRIRPRERRDKGQTDLFRARLDQIVDTNHALAGLGRAIDWRFVEGRCGAAYSDAPGHPPLPTGQMAGRAILKSMHDLPFDRSSMARWRQRMGEEKLNALLQESLGAAIRTEAARPADFTKAIVDTIVQPKAVAHPTDARLMQRSRERLVRLARTLGIELRQSYGRVGRIALIKHQRMPMPSSSSGRARP